jgi:hypothetical protein
MPLLGDIQGWLHSGVSAELKDVAAGVDPFSLMAAMSIAASFGMVHALMPGHGKTVIVSYYLGRPAQFLSSVGTSAILVLTHVGSAVVLVLAGFIVIRRTQRAQSLNVARAPGTRQMAGGADRRCCGVSTSRAARAGAASAAVLAFSSAIRASSVAARANALLCMWGATEMIEHTMMPTMRTRTAGDLSVRQAQMWAAFWSKWSGAAPSLAQSKLRAFSRRTLAGDGWRLLHRRWIGSSPLRRGLFRIPGGRLLSARTVLNWAALITRRANSIRDVVSYPRGGCRRL